MATDFFLKLDGIQGESTMDKHENEIDVLSMSFNVVQPTQIGSGGAGLAAGKAVFGEIHFSKRVDKASPKLYQACGAGTHIAKAEFFGQKAGDKPMVYFKVTLTDVIVSSFSNAGAGGGSEMDEQVSFGYSKIEFEYIEQSAKGAAGPKNLASFNVVKGVKS